MGMSTKEHQPQVARNLDKTVPGLIAQANSIVAAVGSAENAIYFTTPPPTPLLSTISANVALLVAAHSNALNGGKGMVAARDIAERTVRNNMGDLGGYVQSVANSLPGKGSAVILASGFDEKSLPKRKKPCSRRRRPRRAPRWC